MTERKFYHHHHIISMVNTLIDHEKSLFYCKMALYTVISKLMSAYCRLVVKGLPTWLRSNRPCFNSWSDQHMGSYNAVFVQISAKPRIGAQPQISEFKDFLYRHFICTSTKVQIALIMLAWISSDYFESLLLPLSLTSESTSRQCCPVMSLLLGCNSCKK